MARDRLAMILETMAAKKSLGVSHYRIYLCLFSAIQEGKKHTTKSICEITGMHLRTAQKAIKELIKTGNVVKSDEGEISVTFWSGFPAKVQKIESTVQKIESPETVGGGGSQRKVQKGESFVLGKEMSPPGEVAKVQRLFKKEKKENIDTLNKNLYISSHQADARFKELVDGIFQIYEDVIKEKLNPLFSNADGAMVKRMLSRLPDEKIERFLESWKNFLWTDDDFDSSHIKQAPVRYWATRVTKFMPKRQFDVVESYRKKYGKKKDD